MAIALTHDVDNIARPKEHILRVRDRFTEADFAKAMRGELNLYENVELIATKEAEEGFHSSFYFMSKEYPLEKVRETARKLHATGWEIGLHGDFGTHDSQPEMDKAVHRIQEGLGLTPRGLREHYLRFDFSKSWAVMENSGFDYDSTPGNHDKLGFRLGLATPFHPPDADWCPRRILELPLSLMDTTLWGYLKKGEEEGHREVLAAIREVEKVEGLFTLLWHQEAVRMRGGRIYWKVLKDVSRMRGVFVGSGEEVAAWWRARKVLLSVQGDKLITLGSNPPPGLTLVVKVRPGTRLHVTSGKRRTRGEETLVSPSGRGFKVEVAS